MVVLYILLFVVFLSMLIMIHEAGHLMVAKAFKVYCFEYAIGFGPKLFSRKRKNGETAFSIRAVPFGGFVSMYDDSVEPPEGLTIDKSRSINGIKKWKKCLILLAGVFMNAVLAIAFLLISNLAFPQHQLLAYAATVKQDSIAYNAGITEKVNYIYFQRDPGDEEKVVELNKENSGLIAIDTNGYLTLTDASTVEVAAVFNANTSIAGYNALSWDLGFLGFYKTNEEGTYVYVEPKENIVSVSFNLTTLTDPEDNTSKVVHPITLAIESKDSGGKTVYSFESLGLSIYNYTYRYSFARGVGKSFEDFGTYGTVIVRGLGSLFTKEGASSAGGIIAIGFETTNILKNFDFGMFIRIWAMISVNLAIINLLPFPGLDGWQLLVTIIEGASKKKVPDKVKNIVSFIGIGILFALMLLLVFKDIFTYII